MCFAYNHCIHPLLQGTATISVQWGAWAGAGMAGNDASTRARVERTGLGMVEVPAGLASLQGLLLLRATQAPLLAAVPVHWLHFLQKRFKAVPPPMFAEFAEAGAAEQHAGGFGSSIQQQSGPRQAAAACRGLTAVMAAPFSAAERNAFMLAEVQAAVKAVLGGDVHTDEPLMAAGLDSLSSVELRNSLVSASGVVVLMSCWIV